MWRVPLFDLDLGEAERRAVSRVLDDRWLSMGPRTEEFEGAFAKAVGSDHAIAVSSGTAALQLAYVALGVGPGTEVIVPSLTFVAAVNAAVVLGATPVFVDILDPLEPTIDPAELEAKISSKTRAITVLHYGGYPCRIPSVVEIARRHGVPVVEDVAHAPGVFVDGIALSLWGDVGCFSFFANKNLSTGEGGMVVCRKAELAERIRMLRSHGMTSLTWERHRGRARSYDVLAAGFNYRIDEISAALGTVQLEKLPEGNRKRRELTGRYRELLGEIAGVELPFSDDLETSACHIMPIILPSEEARDDAMDRLARQRIQTSIHYPPIHRFSYYAETCPGVSLPKTEDFSARELTLPMYPQLDPAAIEEIATALRSALN